MKHYQVIVNGTTWKVTASTPIVAVKRALDAANKAHPRGIGSNEARGKAIHIYYKEGLQ